MDFSSEELNQCMVNFDLESLPGVDDKADECRFFLGLAKVEDDKCRFRWLISAFLSASYSYFEHVAFSACIACTHPDTGKEFADEVLLSAVREHVDVTQNKKWISHVKTSAPRGVLKKLYDLRHQNTHTSPLSIMSAGPSPPIDFHQGWEIGKGVPLLDFCKSVMFEIDQLQFKKEACEAGAWPPPSRDLPDDY